MGTRLTQHTALTSQLIQSIRLLQLTTQEMQLELRQALSQNPMLEVEEDEESEIDAEIDGEIAAEPSVADLAEAAAPVEIVEMPMSFDGSEVQYDGDGEEDWRPQNAAPESSDIRVRVLEQLLMHVNNERDRAVAEYLVDRVDDNGYLEGTLEEVLAQGARQCGVGVVEIERLRQLMLRQEPVGFGARNLAECLRAQLEFVEADATLVTLATRIVDGALDVLAQHDFAALANFLGVDAGTARRAAELIMSLDPRPGALTAELRHVVPEVVARRGTAGWTVEANPACAPRVRINSTYERMLSRAGDAGGAKAMRELLNDARWLVRGLAMRQDTLMRVAAVVVERQRAFLEQGEELMKSLTLREVADAIGMHESTVSRVTTGKYLQTPRGTFELKYFFSAKLDGAALAGRAVRALVKRLIDAENPEAPLADDAIVTLLARQGVRIARRTVAKYRDQLAIAPAKERRRPIHAAYFAAAH